MSNLDSCMQDRMRRWGDWLPPVLLAIGLCVLVLPFMGRSYWDDELFSVRVSLSRDSLWQTCRLFENNMAAYYLVLYGWIKGFGVTEYATRSLSLLFAIAALVHGWFLFRRFFSRPASWVAALLLLCNPLFIYHAAEARSYAMLLWVSVVATDLFFRLLDRPSRWLFLGYGLTLSLSVYTHYFGLLLLPVHGLATLLQLRRVDRWGRWWLTWVIVLLSVSPLALFKPASTDQVLWMHAPSWKMLVRGGMNFFGGPLLVAGFLGLAGWVWWRYRPRLSAAQRTMLIFCITSLSLPLLVVYAYSIWVQPMFQYRYFIGSLPAAALLVGLLVHQASDRWSGVAWIGAALALGQLVPAMQAMQVKGTGYRDLAAYLVSHAEAGDLVTAYPYFKGDHYGHYLERLAPGKSALSSVPFSQDEYLPGGGGWDPDPDIAGLEEALPGKKTVWLICNPAPREADQRQNRTWLPVIDSLLSRQFARKDSLVFRPEYGAPTKLLIYRR